MRDRNKYLNEFTFLKNPNFAIKNMNKKGKIGLFLNKEISRIIINPKKEGLIIALFLMLFISIPVCFLLTGNKLIMLGINFIYSSIAFISILFFDLFFNKVIFKKKWTYVTEISSLILIFLIAFIIVIIIDGIAQTYLQDLAITNSREKTTLFFIAIIYTSICYGCLKIYRIISLKDKSKVISEKYISVHYKGSIYKLNSKKIILIEAYGNYIKIFLTKNAATENNSPILVRQTLKKINNLILEDKITNLIKCHRSYIINMDFIFAITKDEDKKQYLNLSNLEMKVPISKNMIDILKSHLQEKETISF